MLIVPIGHDQPIRRFPWLTIVLMAICTLVQLWASLAAPSPQELLGAQGYTKLVEHRVLVRFRAELAMDDVGDHPNRPLYDSEADQRILADFREGKLAPRTDELFLALRSADKALDDLGKRNPVVLFGYRPIDGLSINLLLCAFVHAGWLHLVGNMLFLWPCGCNLEDRWGSAFFAAFYSLGAVAASLAWGALHHGETVRAVGASGAIATAMGAFVVSFHSARLKIFWAWTLTRHGVFYVPAYVAGPLWLVGQLIDMAFEAAGVGGTAFSAHVGGFVVGAALAGAMKLTGLEKKLAFDDGESAGWHEDPDYVRALEIMSSQPGEALRLLRAVVQRQPEHRQARRELLSVAILVRDRNVASSMASGVVGQLGETFAWEEIVSLYRELDEALPTTALSDRALALVVRAALRVDDTPLALDVAARLLASHPESPLLRGSLWDLGPLQKREGLEVIAPTTLARFEVAQ